MHRVWQTQGRPSLSSRLDGCGVEVSGDNEKSAFCPNGFVEDAIDVLVYVVCRHTYLFKMKPIFGTTLIRTTGANHERSEKRGRRRWNMREFSWYQMRSFFSARLNLELAYHVDTTCSHGSYNNTIREF